MLLFHFKLVNININWWVVIPVYINW